MSRLPDQYHGPASNAAPRPRYAILSHRWIGQNAVKFKSRGLADLDLEDFFRFEPVYAM